MGRSKPPEQRTGHAKQAATLAVPVRNDAFVTPDMPAAVTNLERWVAVWDLGGPSGAYNVVADFGIISRYCSMIERGEMLLAQLNAEGWTAEGASGQVVVHPVAKLLSDIEAKIGPVEAALGLSPAARNSVSVAQAAARSVLDSWLEA